jgi:nicotinate-nucleotide adenylyltransferase
VGRRHVGLTGAGPDGAAGAGPDGAAAAASSRPWGILGGTFDPIHMGHLAVAEHARQALDLAGVLFVPAAESPFKPDRPSSPSRVRVAMVELAVAGNAAFRVSRIELERPGPSYTVDTLELLHAEGRTGGRGRPDPVLILSVETLPGLVDWRRPERLLELCRIAVVPRRGYDGPAPGWLEQHFPGHADRFQFLDGPDLGHSSSGIRERVASGRSIRYLVPDAVARYVESGRLYGADATDGGR